LKPGASLIKVGNDPGFFVYLYRTAERLLHFVKRESKSCVFYLRADLKNAGCFLIDAKNPMRKQPKIFRNVLGKNSREKLWETDKWRFIKTGGMPDKN
jgi:hypothetical protein